MCVPNHMNKEPPKEFSSNLFKHLQRSAL